MSVAIVEGEAPWQRDTLAFERQRCPHVGQMHVVFKDPAALSHVQVTHPKPSGVSEICVNGLALREPHVGSRKEGTNEKVREGRRDGRKETLVGWRKMVFSVSRSHLV